MQQQQRQHTYKLSRYVADAHERRIKEHLPVIEAIIALKGKCTDNRKVFNAAISSVEGFRGLYAQPYRDPWSTAALSSFRQALESDLKHWSANGQGGSTRCVECENARSTAVVVFFR